MDDDKQTHVTWISPIEAARRLGVTPRTLIRWEELGRLTSVRTPANHRRYNAADIDQLLKAAAS